MNKAGWLKLLCISLIISLGSLPPVLAQPIRFVKATASGSGDGSSWQNASANLQAMLNAVQADSGLVLVASGLFTPTTSTDRYASFSIPSGVRVYGNCLGTETSPEQRILTLPSSTTLSGEIGGPSSTTDNSYHVVVFRNASVNTRLDGFIITRGHNGGSGSVFPDYVGAGIYNSSSASNSNPTIANCQIVNNQASNGGGMYNNGTLRTKANPTLLNCLFAQNVANEGGAFYNDGGSSGQANPIIQSCQFSSNTAVSGDGGALFTICDSKGESSPIIRQSSFIGNQAQAGGAITHFIRAEGQCNAKVINCLFSQNVATTAYGGAIFNFTANNGKCQPTFVNCSFSKNAAIDRYQGMAGGIYTLVGSDGLGNSTIVNCIFWGNTSAAFLSGADEPSLGGGKPTILNSDIEKLAMVNGCQQCSGNVDINPLFVDATANNLQLQASSPVIDKGRNSPLLADAPVDLAGQPRLSGPAPDMGAYEYQWSTVKEEFYTLQPGVWSNITIWSSGQLPSTADQVTIKHAVTIPAGYSATAQQVHYEPGGQLIFGENSQLKVGL